MTISISCAGITARFQLFGDTVNTGKLSNFMDMILNRTICGSFCLFFNDAIRTAARMESNGMRDCIHVSQSTADELVALGKGHWVHAREEKITAKGTLLFYTIPVCHMLSSLTLSSLGFSLGKF